MEKKPSQKRKEKKEKKAKPKPKAKGKAVKYTSQSALVGQGRPSVQPGPSPYMNSGLATLPPLFQIPLGWATAANAGIPADPFAQQRINDPMNVRAGNPPLSEASQAMFDRLGVLEQMQQARDQMRADASVSVGAAAAQTDAAQDQAERNQRAMQSDADEKQEAKLSDQFGGQDVAADMSDQSAAQAASASSSSSYRDSMNQPVNERRLALPVERRLAKPKDERLKRKEPDPADQLLIGFDNRNVRRKHVYVDSDKSDEESKYALYD